MIYPLDHGYLQGTTSGDRGGIRVWFGSSRTRGLVAVILTGDLSKRESEIKLMLGCNTDENQIAINS